MPSCPKCGVVAPDDATFCAKCGSKVQEEQGKAEGQKARSKVLEKITPDTKGREVPGMLLALIFVLLLMLVWALTARWDFGWH